MQLKYKRRVYKMLKLEEKTLRALHTRANLRRFLDWVKDGNVEKVSKMCTKGLDPNFHCQETGGEYGSFELHNCALGVTVTWRTGERKKRDKK